MEEKNEKMLKWYKENVMYGDVFYITINGNALVLVRVSKFNAGFLMFTSVIIPILLTYFFFKSTLPHIYSANNPNEQK